MLRKLFRWSLYFLGLVLLLLLAGGVWLNHYLENNRERLVNELAATSGLHISFTEFDLNYRDNFPLVDFRITDLVVQDTLRAPTLLALESVSGRLTLRKLFDRVIRIEHAELRGGTIQLTADSTGRFNAGSLIGAGRKKGNPGRDTLPVDNRYLPRLDWEGISINLREVDLGFRDHQKNKDLAVRVDSLFAGMTTDADGAPLVRTDLHVFIRRLAFNTEKGAFLTDAPVSGPLNVAFGRDLWAFPETTVDIAGRNFVVSANIERAPGELSHIYLACDSTGFDRTVPLLAEDIREQLAPFHVDGVFPVAVEIISTLERGEDPEVIVDFALDGQNVKLPLYAFRDVYATGRFTNRLPVAEGGIAGSRKNMRVDLTDVRAVQAGMDLRAPHVIVRASTRDVRMAADLTVTGPAGALARRLGNTNFLFERGRFSLTTTVDASLLDVDAMVANSDGNLRMTNLDVRYEPAGVLFPFSAIDVRKTGDDIRLAVRSKPLISGFAFDLTGKIDNLVPLVLDRPGEAINTDVTLHSGRIDWTDFLTFFGQDGYFDPEATGAETSALEQQKQSMKQTMLGLKQAFHPRVVAHFDTVAYYDVFTLGNFTTGLHFEGDTLVLEHTKFNWEGSDVSFRAGLNLRRPLETPFRIAVQTEHLNLNRLRSTLDYFGLQLPAGLDSLPSDLRVDFSHRGILDDSLGIKPGFNRGTVNFDDGRTDLFSGNMRYRPGPEGLQTKAALSGDPYVVNRLFNAENFFFGSGRFQLDLELERTPADLPELVRLAKARLRIDSSNVLYQPAGAAVPIRKFVVNVDKGNAAYNLSLVSDATRRSVAMTGELDNMAAFLFPETGETFRIKTDASAVSLHHSDLRDFIRTEAGGAAGATQSADTASFDPQSFLSATGGIFSSFRPDLSLTIDTFHLNGRTRLLDVFAGVRLRDSTALIIERSGFTLEDGNVRFDAEYALDDRPVSPFIAHWRADSLDLERLLSGLTSTEMIPKDLAGGQVSGTLSMAGTFTGLLDEDSAKLVADSTRGTFDVHLTDLSLTGWPFLETAGRKALMRKRFARLEFAPMAGRFALRNGVVNIPRTEVQSTALQVFVEGKYDLKTGPDMLISLPLRNIGRGVLDMPPPLTGYGGSGWKVYMIAEKGKDGEPRMKFRLGSRRYYKERGRLGEWRREKKKN